MATDVSNHYLAELHRGSIKFQSDSFKICLMASGFSFNRDSHAAWADVSASELAAGNGYTRNTKTLGTADLTSIEDDTNDRSQIAWPDVQWTAAGGSIGPTPGAIIFDDTTADDTIVGYIDFGTNQTATDGGTFTISNITIRAGHSS